MGLRSYFVPIKSDDDFMRLLFAVESIDDITGIGNSPFLVCLAKLDDGTHLAGIETDGVYFESTFRSVFKLSLTRLECFAHIPSKQYFKTINAFCKSFNKGVTK